MSLTDDIKDFALSIGYDRVGVTTAEDFTFYQRQVAATLAMYDWAVHGSLKLLGGVSPTTVMPAARSIIVTISDLFKEAFPDQPTFGRPPRYRCYTFSMVLGARCASPLGTG